MIADVQLRSKTMQMVSVSHSAIAIAHEVGHYLGLEHEDDLPDNLMFPAALNGGKLYGGQGGVMVIHCSVKWRMPNIKPGRNRYVTKNSSPI